MLPAPRLAFDARFLAAALAAPAFWLGVWLTGLPVPAYEGRPSGLVFLSIVLWYPLVEELAFRGALQGKLAACRFGRRALAGLSMANLLTSLAFVAWHLVYQPAPPVLAVFLPSLIFGYFRERSGHVYAPLVLHVVYNASFLLAAPLVAGA